ncbi:Mus7/MMS22 family-domain-containing protein [Schizophyllum commune]
MDSPDPLNLFSSPMQTTVFDAEQDMDLDTHGKSNETGTPTMPLSTPLPTQSPLTSPLSSPARSNLSASPHRTHDPPNQEVEPPEPFDDTLADIGNQTEEPTRGRYSLRKRNAANMNPYTLDQKKYTYLMRNNPEAIVKLRNFARRHGFAAEENDEEESQEFIPEEPHRRRQSADARSRSRDKELSPGEAELLDEFDVDLPRRNEFLKEFQRMERESKRREREEKKKAKEAEKARKEEERARRDEERRRKELAADERRRRQLRAANGHREEARSRSSRSPTPGPSRQGDSASPVSLLSPLKFANVFEQYMQDRTMRSPSPDTRPWDVSPRPLSPIDSPPRVASTSPPAASRANSPLDVEESDDEHAADDANEGSDESGEDNADPIEVVDPEGRKKLKALRRVLPRFMWSKALKKAPPQAKPQRSQTRAPTADASDDDRDVPLQPGQSRVRIVARPRDVRDIKGDPESSDSERSVRSFDSEGSQAIEVRPARPRYRPINISDDDASVKNEADVLDLTGDPTTEEEEFEEVDDDDLRGYFHAGERPKREFSIVDFMLDRTRRLVSGKARQPKKASGRYKFTTAAARRNGGGRQLKLDFSNHRTHKRSKGGTSHRALHRSSSGRASSPHDEGAGSSHRHGSGGKRTGGHRTTDRTHASKPRKDQGEVVELEHDPQADDWWQKRKEKRKLAKERKRLRGLHVFTAGGGLASGFGNRKYVTVDFEDEAVYQALHFEQAPPSPSPHPRHGSSQHAHRPPMSRTQSARSLPAPHHPDPAHDEYEDDEEEEEEEKLKFADKMLQHEIPVLPSGLAFDNTTYIGHGRLRAVLAALSGKDAGEPMPWDDHDVKFSFKDDFATFAAQFRQLCDQLLELATGLPEDDSAKQAEEWSATLKAASEHATWFLQSAPPDERLARLAAMKEAVGRLVDGLRSADLTADAVDSCTFAVALFAVDVSARIYALSSDVTAFVDSAGTLFDFLMRFDLPAVLDDLRAICEEDPFPSILTTTTARWAAQAWVCLIHVLHAPLSERDGEDSRPSLWSFVEPILKADETSHVKKAEHIWRTVFSVCALSQFNHHGFTTAEFHLPAAWSIVDSAMSLTRLEVDPATRPSTSYTERRLMEVYAGIVVFRCYQLWRRCGWNPGEEASHPVMRRLAAIFKSRHYADLRTEKHSDYPAFIREGRLCDLTVPLDRVEKETAFTLFLRLVAATIQKGMDPGRSTPMKIFRARQLLSVWGPLSKVDLETLRTPSKNQLSTLFNRISFAILAIYLDPASCDRRIDQALQSVEFNKASATTRISLMRGLQYMAVTVLHYGPPGSLDRILDWFDTQLKTVLTEYKSETVDIEKNNIMLCGLAIMGCVRRIIAAHTAYPSPHLLLSSLPRFLVECQGADQHKDTAMREHFHIIAAILEGRRNVVPPPERPRIPVTTEEESQSYDVDGFDWNDPALDAVLANVGADPVPQEPEAKDVPAENQTRILTAEEAAALDGEMSKALTAHYWAVWRFLKYAVLHQGISEELSNIVDAWVEAHVVVKKTKQLSWGDLIVKRLGALKEDRPDCAIWLDMRFCLAILTHEPLAYDTVSTTSTVGGRTLRAMCMELLWRSLAAQHVTIEHQYLAAVLNVDGLRHPLLANLPFARAESDEIEISAEEFLQQRYDAVEGELICRPL